jgi:hypothetical protein
VLHKLAGGHSAVIRIRIVQIPAIHDVDGVALDRFHVGVEYDLSTSLASLFLAEGWARPVPLDDPRPYTPFGGDDPFHSDAIYRDKHRPPNLTKELRPPAAQRSIAADIRRRRRRGP